MTLIGFQSLSQALCDPNKADVKLIQILIVSTRRYEMRTFLTSNGFFAPATTTTTSTTALVVRLLFVCTTIQSFKIESYDISCKKEDNMNVTYMINGNKLLTKPMIKVETCKTSYDNKYCQLSDAVWNLQTCELIEKDGYRIKCKVVNPYTGLMKAFKTFALKITINDGAGNVADSMRVAVTPTFRCYESKSRKGRKMVSG